MAESDGLDRLPLPKSWPELAKRALVLVNSMLKASFDIELGRRVDCASRHAREHAEHEGLFLITIPFSLDRMREEVRLIVEHYSRFRPHQGLMCRTPDEVHFNRSPAVETPRWEPRAKWPRTSGCAAPYVPVKGE
ncbi:MAG: hypothetical protein ACYSU0_19460 [Planctomycetota bacterium]|jgi:hypothetical protein